MPRLSQSETRLAAMLGGILFIGAAFFLTRMGLDARAGVIADLETARLQHEASLLLLDEQPMWEARMEWLQTRLPNFASRSEASPATQRLVKSAAQNHGLEVIEQGFLTDLGAENPVAEQVGVWVHLRGKLSGTVGFLHEVQQPGRFIDIRSLNLAPEGEDGTVVCKLDLVQYFHEN